MAFTANEIANIANAALDYYFNKGDTFKQSIQSRPFWDKLESGAKTFPGGKGNISIAVEGDFGSGTNDTVVGYTHDDRVSFFTPANIKRAEYAWREHHIGLTLTHTELKIDGISVVDTNGERTSNHSNREMTVLVNLLEDKLFALGEQYARGMNNLAWGDGTADPKAMAGIQAIVRDDPTVGTVGGLAATNTWWRNRSLVGANAVTSAVADGGALLQALQKEYLQLIRFGGKPNFFVAGSDFIDAMQKEIRANGTYSISGFTDSQDGSMGQMKFMGQNVVYDPTLDDLGYQKRAYWLDMNAIKLFKMENEWRKDHTPARPVDQFLLFRSITSTGAIGAKQLNSSLVIEIA